VGHIYAGADDLKKFMSGGSYGDDRDAQLLITLESSSRRVDAFCKRGRGRGADALVDGFGPVVKTRTYPGAGRAAGFDALGRLLLEGDLADFDTITVDGTTRDPDDFELIEGRRLKGNLGSGRDIAVGSTWGLGYQVYPTGLTLTADLDDSSEALTVSDGLQVFLGETLVIGTEQLLVTAVAEDAVTARRAQNGTTAATHATDDPINSVHYLTEVVDATIRIAQKRWKSRDAGFNGNYGGTPAIPMTMGEPSELVILMGTVGHLAVPVVR
jgi:hypothetical protein